MNNKEEKKRTSIFDFFKFMNVTCKEKKRKY